MRINASLKALVLAVVMATALPAYAQQQGTQTQQREREKSPGLMGRIFGRGSKDKREQEGPKRETQGAPQTSTPQTATQQTTAEPTAGSAGQTTQPQSSSTIPAELQAGRRESASEEEAAIVPYYNNFLKDYRLGPEDVISVDVFNQPRYSKPNITVPPDGRISFPLIAEGIRVVGKTTQQVQEEIQKKLEEYILTPQVTVYLDKAMSARYSVLGDVGKPGVMIMTRRVSLIEALAEAGGVLETGDKKKVVILRRRADGNLAPVIVNVSDIEKGRAREMAYLAPGDQVIVPGNRLKSIQQLMRFTSILSFGRIFGLPF
ncbi:MAG TPA: polysaccharide biosynthesis/export family protein [Pyrinomonadaceae bacterium]